MPLDLVDSSSSSGSLEGYGVYIGVLGSTLTVSRRDGDLLVAVLAFFVTFVFTRFWRILCVVLHHQSSSDRPREALYHQRQAAFRNVASPEAALTLFAQMIWAWRHTSNSKHMLKIMGVPLLVATLCLTASVVASSFSSRLTSGVGDEVLLHGGMCGWIDGSRDMLREGQQAYLLPWVATQTLSSANYAKECYSVNPGGVLSCDTFVKPNLLGQIEIETDVPCPFGGDICVKDHANLRIDSGLIESNNDLGMNAPSDLRFQYRIVLQCAPIKTENYTSSHNISSERSYTRYHYGRANNFGVPGVDWVYIQSNDREYERRHVQDSVPMAQGDYDIGVAYASPLKGLVNPDHHSSMFPVRELMRTDGDLQIVFLAAKGITYFEPSDDDWYRANKPGGNITYETPIWVQDGPASPLACLEQYQFCNPSLPPGSNCAPLSGRTDAQLNAIPLFSQSKASEALLSWAEHGFDSLTSSVGGFPDKFGSISLHSRKYIQASIMPKLPSNQWQLDVSYRFATVLAILQRTVVTFAAGPSRINPDIERWIEPPHTPEERYICENQRIRSTSYSSFNVLSLGLIVGIGLLTVLVSYTLVPCISYVQENRKSKSSHSVVEWTTNETLQLQRLVHEAHDGDDVVWVNATDAIPITKTAHQPLAVLHVRDPLHPKLTRAQRDGTEFSFDKKGTGFSETTIVQEVVVEEKKEHTYNINKQRAYTQSTLGITSIRDLSVRTANYQH
ncbi:hypothetical protein V8F33_010430 [Rhypophila sp. PSN 637]